MEQLALDELVGLVARTQLLGRRGLGLVQLLLWLVLAKLVLGELVLIRIPAGGEISDEDQQHDERTDQPERRPVGSTHGTPNVAAALRVHYWRRPSCSLTTRSIFAARRSLWVATSAALPSPRTRLRNSPRTASAVCSSRFPVGSSASTSGGLLASARATATRCCSPPESLDGRWSSRSDRPRALSNCFARSRAAGVSAPRTSWGRTT